MDGIVVSHSQSLFSCGLCAQGAQSTGKRSWLNETNRMVERNTGMDQLMPVTSKIVGLYIYSDMNYQQGHGFLNH